MWVFHCHVNFRGDKHSIWCHLSGYTLRGSYLKEWKTLFLQVVSLHEKIQRFVFFFQLLYIQTVLLHSLYVYGGFLKWWYPTTMGFPTKTYHFGVFRGYHHLRKHPYIYIHIYIYGVVLDRLLKHKRFWFGIFNPFLSTAWTISLSWESFFDWNRCKSFWFWQGSLNGTHFAGDQTIMQMYGDFVPFSLEQCIV